jgi:hypothetical protein
VFGTRIVVGKLTYVKTVRSAERLNTFQPWLWLKGHPPESYEQLIGKLKQSMETYGRTTRTLLRQLAQVFEWCQAHDIELSLFDLPGHISHYRYAARRLYNEVTDPASDAEAEQGLREVIALINGQKATEETIAWVRKLRE